MWSKDEMLDCNVTHMMMRFYTPSKKENNRIYTTLAVEQTSDEGHIPIISGATVTTRPCYTRNHIISDSSHLQIQDFS